MRSAWLSSVMVLGLSFGCTEVSAPGGPGEGPGETPAPSCTSGQARCADAYSVEECVDGQWLDSLTCGQGEICEDSACKACPSISFNVETYQSCALGLDPGTELDAESFINISGTDYRVMAMDRWGEGHILAWCDSSSFGDLIEAFDVFGYLGQVDAPRVASIGDPKQCQPPNAPDCAWYGLCSPLPTSISYLGEHLPASYQNNAGQLAADYDVLVFCGFQIPWTTDWSAEIAEFVSVHGKGLAAIGEYHTYAYPEDFVGMSNITAPTGIRFEQINLEWSATSTDVVLECVPGVPSVE